MLSLVRQEFAARRVVDTLKEYIRIPNQSPNFDAAILTNGHQDRAVDLLVAWVKQQHIPNLSLEVLRLPERTPLIVMEIPAFLPELHTTASTSATALIYGHFDKQPPLFEGGWIEGGGPYTPVVTPDGQRLYGRGGADDGYAIFGAITALAALHKAGKPHPKICIVIEGSEESGSRDLPAYMELLRPRIEDTSLVVCLDSGCGNYDQLWVTSSLRGIVVGDLKVSVLTEGVHSGDASGVVPSSFRIARALLSRLEDQATGEILPRELHCSPEDAAHFFDKAREAGRLLARAGMVDCFPFLCSPVIDGGDDGDSYGELAVNRWWKPQLEVIGAGGFPLPADAGNVLRPSSTLTLSLRLPPTVDKQVACAALTKVLAAGEDGAAPYKAKVEFTISKASQGWSAPVCAPWLHASLQAASASNFEGGKPAVFQGEGGSIPFMGQLGAMLPAAQFFVCGVLGPGSNAHGPNEFLHLDYCQRVIACVACVLTDACTATTTEGEESSRKMPRVQEDAVAREYGRNADGTKI